MKGMEGNARRRWMLVAAGVVAVASAGAVVVVAAGSGNSRDKLSAEEEICTGLSETSSLNSLRNALTGSVAAWEKRRDELVDDDVQDAFRRSDDIVAIVKACRPYTSSPAHEQSGRCTLPEGFDEETWFENADEDDRIEFIVSISVGYKDFAELLALGSDDEVRDVCELVDGIWSS